MKNDMKYLICQTCKGKGVVPVTIETKNDNVVDCPDCEGKGRMEDEDFAYQEYIDNNL